MSEVEEILNNLPRDEQSRRRVWEWMQSQVDDGGEQESESQAEGSGKFPPHPDRTNRDESQPQVHGDSNGLNSGSNGANWQEQASLHGSPMPSGSTAAHGGPPRRGLRVSDGSSAALGRSNYKGKSPFGKPRHSKGGLCSLATTPYQ